MSEHGRYAPNYVFINRGPGLVGVVWWLLSIGLLLDQPVGALLGERTFGLWSLPAGAASWILYSLWRVSTTHIWHSAFAHATLGRYVFRRYPSEEAVRSGDYFDR